MARRGEGREVRRVMRAGGAGERGWAVAAALGALLAAAWLRSPGELYLAGAVLATAVTFVLLPRGSERGRLAAVLGSAALAGTLLVAGVAQRTLWRVAGDWPAYREELVRASAARLEARVRRTAGILGARARAALAAPGAPDAAFEKLAELASGAAGGGVVLYRSDTLAAWSGRVVARTDSLRAPLGVERSPFYVTLYATAVRGRDRAVAVAVVHAEPPADRLVRALDARVVETSGLRRMDVRPPAGALEAGSIAVRVGGRELLRVRPVAPGQEEARLRILQRARVWGLALLAAALAALTAAVWRRERQIGWCLAPLAVALAALALAPLNALSNSSALFDPGVYFTELGRALTASTGALIATGVTLAMGMLLVARSRLAARWPAAALVAAVVAFGPPLVRALSRGVMPPPSGVTGALWLSWEVSLFLVAATLLIVARWAGAALVRGGGVPAWIAPGAATLVALAGPLVTEVPSRWPAWYPAAWMGVVAALALSRRHRGWLLTAGWVAALAAATLTWNAGVRGRIAQAARDLARLSVPDADVAALLQREGERLAGGTAPRTESALLRAYASSALAGAGYPVRLTAWRGAEDPLAEVALAPFEPSAAGVAGVMAAAVRAGRGIVRAVPGVPGVSLVLAVPYADGTVMTMVVAPRTRLIPDLPFATLLGLEARERGEAPYALTLAPDLPPGTRTSPGISWQREAGAVHGHRVVATPAGTMRAHIVVERRPLAALVQRGTLVVIGDVLLLAALWLLTALPSRAFRRWLGARVRRGRASYRVRLTGALFAFFVLPAAGFAVWSYRQLESEDRQARELLVLERLRAASTGALPAAGAATAPEAMPLLLYDAGELRQASGPLFEALAPIGRLLPPAVWMTLGAEGEEHAALQTVVAGQPALFGFRALGAAEGERRFVLGAPAPGNEQALERRRRDLGVLVLFTTVLGAAAALWLSGGAARSLARPIGRLRHAALAIAAGEREPPLSGEPPLEFAPVFSAFRRMAADLAASRLALERAQRRTAAVLRQVASGVVAVDDAGAVSLANPRATALLGRSLAPGEALPPNIAARVRSFVAGEAAEEEFELTMGARRLQARVTRAGGDGGAVLTLDDVTELARAQRVLAWGEMARQVAHEIKNPLTPIRLGVQHLRRARADAREDFDRILEDNVARILAEIDRLDEIARTFSRYGAGPDAPPAPPLDVGAVARDVLALERMGAGEVTWRSDLPDVPLMAHAREEELREVLLNVMENARHAGARHVAVHGWRDGARVWLTVADDGAGVPPEVLPRIFEPHFSTRTSGSGLGLAICRQLVERWGGTIELASTAGGGTTVRLGLAAAG